MISEFVETPLELDRDSVWVRKGDHAFAYSDGAEVERYLEKVLSSASDLSSASVELEAGIRDWPTAYHLSRARGQLLEAFHFDSGARVLLVERARFPRDKVCGEFVSAEGVAVLDRLGLLDVLIALGATRLDSCRLTDSRGAAIEAPLPALPRVGREALGISRSRLDQELLCPGQGPGKTRYLLHRTRGGPLPASPGEEGQEGDQGEKSIASRPAHGVLQGPGSQVKGLMPSTEKETIGKGAV